MDTPSTDNVLAVDALTKRFGERDVLREVSLSLRAGERLALMGPSGSGKSTLLNCAGGIEPFDGGEVSVAGESLRSLDGEALAALRRRKVGTVFQFFHLLPTLTAAESVELPLQLIGIPGRERHTRVQNLLEETGVAHRADALPEQLSGGEQQRVAIARALVHQPLLILADEPTGNLDSRTGERVLNLLERVLTAHNTALLMVTHSEASTRICPRTLQMLDGRIVSKNSIHTEIPPANAVS